jgi:hypothetical protein
MDNHEIALEQQGGSAYSSPVGTHFTVRVEDKASFGRGLYEGSKIVRVPFMIATVLETDRIRFRFRLVSPTTKRRRAAPKAEDAVLTVNRNRPGGGTLRITLLTPRHDYS